MLRQRVQRYGYSPRPLAAMLADSPYQSYVYAYPHKTAYRPLPQPVPLDALWADEPRGALFLYMHIPFCEMRCGFCNLFTTVRPDPALVEGYVATLERQAAQVRGSLGAAAFARAAIGGGTPSYLSVGQLERVLNVATEIIGADLGTIPLSVEVSPETAAADKLRLLRERGASRISIGVQSFDDAEVGAVHRRQQASEVSGALERIRATGVPTLNIDLMYGLPGQTVESWLDSLRTALRFQPEELFLYPLYVRPVTRMGSSAREWDDIRLACYRAGRDLLLAEGYTQQSMRLFRAPHTEASSGPVYCCQEDGMVGLGCGARSYTRSLHYSSNYAVGPQHVNTILRAFVETPDEEFGQVSYGFELDGEEQRRRFLLLSLLAAEGVDLPAYEARFGSPLLADFPQLHDLETLGLATCDARTLRLTPAGVERSDTIGPWLFSAAVCQTMEGFALQ